jgi:hypothetical protein
MIMNAETNHDEYQNNIPEELSALLKFRSGAASLLEKLPKYYSPEQISHVSPEQRSWELIGLYYFNSGRVHEALSVFFALYNHMLDSQFIHKKWVHKGLPLVWISDCYARMGHPALSNRYLMLTLCEDAIRGEGIVCSELTGVYFRLVWSQGISDEEVRAYSKQIFILSSQYPETALFPELILQSLDQNWMTEYPSPKEATIYVANTRYIRYLISKLGDKEGRYLEYLAEYILSCMPGCRTYRRKKSKSTDYDIVCSMEGFEVDFRSEFERYFVCECKDWKKKVDFSAFAKFCRVLDSTKSRFGILFSKNGISGSGKTTDAEREQLKVYQDRGMVIVVIDYSDLSSVCEGANFINLLRSKYEKVRLDLIK